MKLTVKNGSFAYSNGPLLCQNINFAIESGEVLSIMGPNGVGKTTLLRCIMNLLPWQTGEAWINDQPVKQFSSHTFWRQIAYVPQAKDMRHSFTVRDFVLMGRNLYIDSFGKPGKADIEKAEEMMQLTGISELANRQCCQLSGGQFQLVLIARALCVEPSCLILDEPESNLDFRNQLMVLNLIEKLAKEHHLACIFNTHYPEHGLRIADQAILVFKNNHVLTGKTSDIVTEENLERLFSVKVHMAQNIFEEKCYQTITALKLL